MFKYEWLNKLVLWVVVGAASMFALMCLWNFVMPTLGVAKLTLLQFTALFVIVHSLKIELIGIKNTKKVDEKKNG